MNKVVIIDAATAMLHVSLLCTLLGVGEVMKVSLDCQEIDGSKEEVAPLIQQLLQDKAALLKECFSIEVDTEGRLTALPQLIEGHCPDLNRLPSFVLQLARDVDWEDEKQCFRGLAQVMQATPSGQCKFHLA